MVLVSQVLVLASLVLVLVLVLVGLVFVLVCACPVLVNIAAILSRRLTDEVKSRELNSRSTYVI